MWRELLEKLRRRVLIGESPEDSEKETEEAESVGELTTWAKFWRRIIQEVLPPAKFGGLPVTDCEVRLLAARLWRDFTGWVSASATSERRLKVLFEGEGSDTKWEFIPATDLLLCVGDGVFGISADGVFAKNSVKDWKRQSFLRSWRGAKKDGRKRGLNLVDLSQPHAKKSKL